MLVVEGGSGSKSGGMLVDAHFAGPNIGRSVQVRF